jgi:transketolase
MTNDVTLGVTLGDMANAIRALAMDAVEQAKSGHPGMPMGMADAATVLWTRFLNFDPMAPHWPDRDRFVLSAGHGSMLLYSLLYLTGFDGMGLDQLQRFRKLGSRAAGHPEFGEHPAIETTTGPLGQGLANAVGMALAERLMSGQHGSDLVDHWTYVIVGDGCLMEGISHEAASLAGHLQLGRLVVLYDDNGISIDGPTSLAVSDDAPQRFDAYGWHTQRVDGHDLDAVAAAISTARADPRPSLIACRTVIGYGAPGKQGKESAHGAPLGEAEVVAARKALGWPYPPFEIPSPILAAWRLAGERGGAVRRAWEARLCTALAEKRAAFLRAEKALPPPDLAAAIEAYKSKLVQERPNWATRKASEEALKVLTAAIPEMVGGSADLTHSNNTITPSTRPVKAKDFGGRYIHYGVREHAMAAAMNGIALHRGLIPYGGTFLVFSDYCRNSIRLSAMMGLRVIYVMTHDSIGLGEDGPTHQPVEHLASLRAIPNLLVFRPADAVETAECWQVALEQQTAPSLLALTRQAVPALRIDPARENLCARGGYVLAEAEGRRALTLLATGSEVHIAMEARAQLSADGIATTVVSMPSFELFEQQDRAWRNHVLGNAPRVAVEAASPFGWTRYVDSEDDVLGMRGFGASAPAKDLYQHFGITAEALVKMARARVAGCREAAD